MQRILHSSLLLGALLLATGFTQCNYYTTVTVPASDGTAPWLNYVVYDNELGHQFFVTEYTLASADEQVVAVASSMDDGGVQSISMRWWADLECCQGNVCETYSHIPFGGTLTDAQAGGVGSVVSNGLWVGRAVKPRDFCAVGWEPSYFEFWWETTATDFHGNTATRMSGRITY